MKLVIWWAIKLRSNLLYRQQFAITRMIFVYCVHNDLEFSFVGQCGGDDDDAAEPICFVIWLS